VPEPIIEWTDHALERLEQRAVPRQRVERRIREAHAAGKLPRGSTKRIYDNTFKIVVDHEGNSNIIKVVTVVRRGPPPRKPSYTLSSDDGRFKDKKAGQRRRDIMALRLQDD
jgi:hypothetical protein